MAANITSVKSPLLPVFIFPSTQETIDLPTQQFIIRTIPRINRFSRVYDYNHDHCFPIQVVMSLIQSFGMSFKDCGKVWSAWGCCRRQ